MSPGLRLPPNIPPQFIVDPNQGSSLFPAYDHSEWPPADPLKQQLIFPEHGMEWSIPYFMNGEQSKEWAWTGCEGGDPNNRYDSIAAQATFPNDHQYQNPARSIDDRTQPGLLEPSRQSPPFLRELVPFTVRPKRWGTHRSNNGMTNAEQFNKNEFNKCLEKEDSATEIRPCRTRQPIPSSVRLQNGLQGSPRNRCFRFSQMDHSPPDTPPSLLVPDRSVTPTALTPPNSRPSGKADAQESFQWDADQIRWKEEETPFEETTNATENWTDHYDQFGTFGRRKSVECTSKEQASWTAKEEPTPNGSDLMFPRPAADFNDLNLIFSTKEAAMDLVLDQQSPRQNAGTGNNTLNDSNHTLPFASLLMMTQHNNESQTGEGASDIYPQYCPNGNFPNPDWFAVENGLQQPSHASLSGEFNGRLFEEELPRDQFYPQSPLIEETPAMQMDPMMLQPPTLESLSVEYRKLLKNIPRKSREAFSPSDEAAFRTCHPHFSRNCYILMHNGYDIRLGEVGRAALKKEISRRLKGDSQLRERCVSVVCRLKNANVLQLLQMAEISGCLALGLKISSSYWKEYSRKQRPGPIGVKRDTKQNGFGSNRYHRTRQRASTAPFSATRLLDTQSSQPTCTSPYSSSMPSMLLKMPSMGTSEIDPYSSDSFLVGSPENAPPFLLRGSSTGEESMNYKSDVDCFGAQQFKEDEPASTDGMGRKRGRPSVLSKSDGNERRRGRPRKASDTSVESPYFMSECARSNPTLDQGALQALGFLSSPSPFNPPADDEFETDSKRRRLSSLNFTYPKSPQFDGRTDVSTKISPSDLHPFQEYSWWNPVEPSFYFPSDTSNPPLLDSQNEDECVDNSSAPSVELSPNPTPHRPTGFFEEQETSATISVP